MDKNIEVIYEQNIKILANIDKAIYYFRTQNYNQALRTSVEIINQTADLIGGVLVQATYFNSHYTLVDATSMMDMLKSLLEAQESNDYILLADLYEIQFGAFLLQLQEVIVSKEELIFDKDRYNRALQAIGKKDVILRNKLQLSFRLEDYNKKGYWIEYASCGLMTLALDNNEKKLYLHSNNKIQNEAFTLANSWYNEEKSDYIIYGLGLGYPIEELYLLDESIKISIYESDLNIIHLACAFGNMDFLCQQANIELIYDPDFTRLTTNLGNMNSKTEFVMHYPSIGNIKNPKIKEQFEDYFLQYSSQRNQMQLMKGNFNANIHNYDASVDELSNIFLGKDLYIIAAGPSLDLNYLQLKNANKNSIILATGTVFKKLVSTGIRPDYIIVSDATPMVYDQIKDMEKEKIPLLLLSTAYKELAKNYQGMKYLICQKDFSRSEDFAIEKGYSLYRTGGSVSTIALDLGISFRCKRIIFLGLDLAYTKNSFHASGTTEEKLFHTENLKQVEDINGGTVYTSKNLDIYRKWIEKRINDEKSIEIIDASEGGAKIRGMRIAKLSDVI